MLHNGLLNLRV